MRRSVAAGFTLTELVVAVTVAGLLLGLVSQIFLSTQQAVRRGIGISDAVGGTRPVAQMLDLDATYMMGPQDGKPGAAGGGLLMIHSHTVPNVAVPKPGSLGGEITRDIRDDQVLWIRRTAGLLPTTPYSSTTLATVSSVDADHARVWYGHTPRTNANGTPGPGLGSGGDVLGTNWLMGRQALLMGNSSILGGTNATGLAPISPVTGGGAPAGATVSRGYSDYSNKNLDSLISFLNSGSYKDNAEVLLFIDKNARLYVNPSPGNPTTGAVTSPAIAQTHPFLMNHVSDLLVEFAADVNLDGQIDLQPGGSTIQWYGGKADAAAGVIVPPTTYPPMRIAGGDTLFVWQHDDEANAAGVGTLTGSATQVSYWPYLVRIRYRVHDRAGTLSTPDLTDGKQGGGFWFEHVIRVKRP